MLAGTIICAGTPGSGNGIAGAILETLVPDPPHLPPEEEAARFVAGQRTVHVMTVADAMAHDHGFKSGAIATHKRGTASISFQPRDENGETVVIFGVPISNALYEHVHKTHEIYSPHIDNLIDQGAGLIVIYRNPLDTLVSVAKKIANCGFDIFSHPEILKFYTSSLIEYYRSFPDLRHHDILRLRYEDLFTDFEGQLTAIKDFVSLRRNITTNVDAITPALLGAEVGNAGHRWIPGAGKWEQFIPARLGDCLNDYGLIELTNTLGYGPVDLARLPRAAEEMPVIGPPRPGSIAFIIASARSDQPAFTVARLAGVGIKLIGDTAFAAYSPTRTSDAIERLLADGRLTDLLKPQQAPPTHWAAGSSNIVRKTMLRIRSLFRSPGGSN